MFFVTHRSHTISLEPLLTKGKEEVSLTEHLSAMNMNVLSVFYLKENHRGKCEPWSELALLSAMSYTSLPIQNSRDQCRSSYESLTLSL